MDEKTKKKIEDIRKKHGKVGLNLGCYDDIKEGYINLDKEKFFEGIDVVHNLESLPYPFEGGTFDEVIAICLLEHLDLNRIDFFKELYRICKNNAIIKLKVPYKDEIMRNPDHKGGGGFNFQYFRRLCNQKNYIIKTMIFLS